jgi:predicted ribosome quality control (RQC) complex YloA/Tae2 family protein
MKIHIHNGITYKVGQRDTENWAIILAAEKDYYWVHLDKQPSAHVIVETDVLLPEDLAYAAVLCKKQTRVYKPNVPCCATQVGNLKLGSKPGEVIFRGAVQHFYN